MIILGTEGGSAKGISSISSNGEDVLEDDDPAVPLYNYLEAGGRASASKY